MDSCKHLVLLLFIKENKEVVQCAWKGQMAVSQVSVTKNFAGTAKKSHREKTLACE